MVAIAGQAATAARWNEAAYRRLLSDGHPPRVALVVDDEAVLGFVIARAIGGEWEIENLAIAESARRRGLGTRLLSELLKIARWRGARSIFLEVRESNQAARALYEKAAFAVTGRRKNYYTEPLEDGVVYHLAFSESTELRSETRPKIVEAR
jgi:ribosomal-protein-alanine acetyltransferase